MYASFTQLLGAKIIPEHASSLFIYHHEKPQSTSYMTCAYKDLASLTSTKFDYIVLLPDVVANIDLQVCLQHLNAWCMPATRLIIAWRAPWRFLKKVWGFRDIELFLKLAGYIPITRGASTIIPFYIPVVSWFFNTFVPLIPGTTLFCSQRWLIARPVPQKNDTQNYVVSVIIPCRNERGTIELAVQRCPSMGKYTELIFVDGHSTDGTVDEMYRVQQKYPEKSIKVLQQTERGKFDGVQLGFTYATGNILMILDSDLTVPPEELPKFYEALVAGNGELINGSRFIYPMEKGAMPPLNKVANRAFGFLLSWITGQKMKDTLCGTKVLWKHDYDAIARNRAFLGVSDPFGDFDLLFGAAKLNRAIIDVPVHYKSRVYGSSQIGSYFHNGILLLLVCWRAFKKFKL